MSTYILAKDYYAEGAFDVELRVAHPPASPFGTPVTIEEFLKVTDPREFNSTRIKINSASSPSEAIRTLQGTWKAKKTLVVDYVAFNQHRFDTIRNGTKLIYSIIIGKLTSTTFDVLSEKMGTTINTKDNLIFKFNPVTLNKDESIVVLFSLNSHYRFGNNYGDDTLTVSYIQIGQSYKMRELSAPLQIPYGASYKSENQKSDQGFVINTKSKQLPTEMTIKFKNQSSTFHDNNEWKNLSYDLSRNPFFIYDDGGNLPLVPFCWLKNKTGQMSLNTNHLYDVTLKAQVKVYE